jgi:hypothetical protein
MPRKYESIWLAIKTAPVGEEVPVKVHGTAVRTLRQAVLKEKSMETAGRKRLGMRFAGKLEIREVTDGVHPHGYAIVYFKLSWDGSRL